MDLCDALDQVSLMCPLKIGPHTASINVNIPGDVPGVSCFCSQLELLVFCLHVSQFSFYIVKPYLGSVGVTQKLIAMPLHVELIITSLNPRSSILTQRHNNNNNKSFQ